MSLRPLGVHGTTTPPPQKKGKEEGNRKKGAQTKEEKTEDRNEMELWGCSSAGGALA